MYEEYRSHKKQVIMANRRISTNTPGIDHLMNITDGFKASQTVSTACELELFDIISQSAGASATAAEIAGSRGWEVEVLERVLNALVALKVLDKDASKGSYKVSEIGRPLVRSDKYSLWQYAQFSKFFDYPAQIKKALKKEPHEEHKEHKGDSHEGHEGHGDEEGGGDMTEFYTMFDGMLKPHLDPLLKQFDLSKYKSVCDLGGGSGMLACELSRRHGMEGWLFEAPSIIDNVAKKAMEKEENKDLNVHLVGGDFEKDDLPKADLYLAVRVVYHWTDANRETMLKRVHDSINDGGAFLFFEELLEDGNIGPVQSHMWDMCILTDDSRVRSGTEYKHLLQKAGFKNITIVRTQPECPYDAIFAEKV